MTKLACITLSWSAHGLDKTACWPIKLGEWQLYPRALVFSTHPVFSSQGLSFHYCRSVPQTRHTDLPFTFTKKNSFVYLSLKLRHSAPTFLFLLAISRFSQCESPLVVVTCQSLRTQHDEMTCDDSYADVVFNNRHGLETQTPTPGAFNCTYELIFPEFIFCECIYGLPRGPDQTVSQAVYSPEARGSPPLD